MRGKHKFITAPIFSAYIDPNSGGLLFQLLATTFIVISGFILFFYSRIKMAFARIMRYLRSRFAKQKNE